MLTKDDFIRHILGEAARSKSLTTKTATGHIDGFDFADDATDSGLTEDIRFVTPLLQAGFGDGQGIPRATVIRSTDAVARHIPDEVRYWPKTPTRPHHTLLIEANLTHRELLAIPAFRSRELAHLDIAEDALARLVAEALEGFHRASESLDASALKGHKHETLCIVSIIDAREEQTGRIACFGTFNAKTEGLETFFLTKPTGAWDRAEARERLGLIYERQFKRLGEASWQQAFTATDERKRAERLLEVCTKKKVIEKEVQESILDLLDSIAAGFGLRKRPNVERRLQAFPLPGEHDIGIDSEERETNGSTNPFSGVTLRDEESRLLGYIVYPLRTKAEAERLRRHLERHNRFHNVLVVYPDANQASIELWQGREQLTGKLRRGHSHKDAADVVNLLSRFFVVSKARVRNPSELAQELAYRARYLRRLALNQLKDEGDEGPLRTLYSAFRNALLHDLSEPEFADAFAQTLTYSLLTARWVLGAQNDAVPRSRFSRKEAMKRLSIGSRFLAEIFDAVLAMKLEDRGRLLWLVDDITDLLDRIDIESVFAPDGTDVTSDPVIHFYEPFLKAYDATIRTQRGAFYTPQPVVSYIVRSVHELLQTEFGLADGLADTTTWGEIVKNQPSLPLPSLTDEPGEHRTISVDEPFVQILDPATGTGTFLVEVIDTIHRTLTAKWKQQQLSNSEQRAVWNDYVPRHLLPRLHAFELMMAPYAIAHMKVGLKLAETGYCFGTEERARIYLTNALESSVQQLPAIGFDALAHEAAAVNDVKRHKRFTVVIGNPPYSNYGQLNTNPWIVGLLDRYKQGLGEKKLNLDDDCIKFFSMGQWTVDKAGAGFLGMITNHTYLEGVTHRQMRRRLLSTFNLSTFLDLHGNVRKSEAGPGATKDENVFDIQQGVAISLLARCPKTPKASRVRHAHVWGSRETKYRHLAGESVASTSFASIEPSPPYFFFAQIDLSGEEEYKAAPSIAQVFPAYGCGFATSRDAFVTDFDREPLGKRIKTYFDTDECEAELATRFQIRSYRAFSVADYRRQHRFERSRIVRCHYRPFDDRWVYYDQNIVQEWQRKTMQHLGHEDSLALITARLIKGESPRHFFASRRMVEKISLSNKTSNNAFAFPLYLYAQEQTESRSNPGRKRTANLSSTFLAQLAGRLGLRQSGGQGLPTGVTPEDIFHYAYAVFHSPGYRNRYAQFLKVDFPRLPLAGDLKLFRALARLGGELTALHVFESPRLEQPRTEFIGGRNRTVERTSWDSNTVWVDKARTTGFRGVQEPVWNFHIGGYPVCQKWLKDRQGRMLTKGDIAHYEKIVIALSETIRIMQEIDDVIERRGGWPGAFTTKSSAA